LRQKQVGNSLSPIQAQAGFKVIVYFTEDEEGKVNNILKELGMEGDKNEFPEREDRASDRLK
jgi:hypothetical protein